MRCSLAGTHCFLRIESWLALACVGFSARTSRQLSHRISAQQLAVTIFAVAELLFWAQAQDARAMVQRAHEGARPPAQYVQVRASFSRLRLRA
jgi:hypothetical protein